jgi:putative FmdB family regulatory protein
VPLYEYLCEDCGGRFEKYVRSWREPVACPVCEGARVEKQLSSFAFSGTDGGLRASAGGGCACGRGGCGCQHR